MSEDWLSRRSLATLFRLLLSFGVLAASAAHAQTFNLSPDEFQSKLDAAFKRDADENADSAGWSIKTCAGQNTLYQCTFNDQAFQRSKAQFKQRDRDVSLELTMEILTQDSNVSKIVLRGSRSDGANLLQFYTTVIAIIHVFDPTAISNDEQLKAMLGRLGLMPDQASDEVKEVKTAGFPFGLVGCMLLPLADPVSVTCEWTPR